MRLHYFVFVFFFLRWLLPLRGSFGSQRPYNFTLYSSAEIKMDKIRWETAKCSKPNENEQGYCSKPTYGTVSSVPDPEPGQCTVNSTVPQRQTAISKQMLGVDSMALCWAFVCVWIGGCCLLKPNRRQLFSATGVCVSTEYVTIWHVTHEWHICITFQQHESHRVHDVYEVRTRTVASPVFKRHFFRFRPSLLLHASVHGRLDVNDKRKNMVSF